MSYLSALLGPAGPAGPAGTPVGAGLHCTLFLLLDAEGGGVEVGGGEVGGVGEAFLLSPASLVGVLMMTDGLGVVGVDGPHVGGAAGFMGVAMELPASRTMMSSILQ